jgi:hypothetical protein
MPGWFGASGPIHTAGCVLLLLPEAAKMRFDVGALSGEDLQAMTSRLFALPARIRKRAKLSLIYKPPN